MCSVRVFDYEKRTLVHTMHFGQPATVLIGMDSGNTVSTFKLNPVVCSLVLALFCKLCPSVAITQSRRPVIMCCPAKCEAVASSTIAFAQKSKQISSTSFSQSALPRILVRFNFH